MDGLELEQEGFGGELGIQSELADLRVIRSEGGWKREYRYSVAGRDRNTGGKRGKRPERCGPQSRLPARAVEYGEADVQQPEAVAVAGRDVQVPLLRPAFVLDQIGIHHEPRAQASVVTRKRPLAVPREGEELRRPPVSGEGEVGHGLAELGLPVRVLDEVGLVHDVDRVVELRDPPEDPVDPEPRLPLPVVELTVEEEVRLAHIGVGAPRVRAVPAEEGGHGEAPALGVLEKEGRLHNEAGRVRALAGIGRGLWVPPTFQAVAPGERMLDVSRLGPSVGRDDERPERSDHSERPDDSGLAAGGERRHHRARFTSVLARTRPPGPATTAAHGARTRNAERVRWARLTAYSCRWPSGAAGGAGSRQGARRRSWSRP